MLKKQLQANAGWLRIVNTQRRQVYVENPQGYWYKQIFGSDGNLLGVEDSTGYSIDYRLLLKATKSIT